MSESGKNSRLILPVSKPLSACISVPGSKSHTNRALLLSALANGITSLRNALFSDDTNYFSNALTKLGFDLAEFPDENLIVITGLGGRIPANNADLFLGNAGTAVRFLTAMITLGNGLFTLDGVPRMRQRPIGDLVSALNNLGAHVSGTIRKNLPHPSNGPQICPPVTISANGLKGGTTKIRGEASSQYISAVLMAAPYASMDVILSVEGNLNSKPYIDLTLGVMRDFGVKVDHQGYSQFKVSPQKYISPGDYSIESDASSASYFFAAPAICGGWVEVQNISRETKQGDLAFLDGLARMGCDISYHRDRVRVTGSDKFEGIDINMADISDTAMTIAVIAPFAQSPTTIRGIASSRLKETNRVSAVCNELKRLGVQVEEHPDGMTIYPCKDIRPGRIRTYDDHRMAMAFSLLGLRFPGIEIENPKCVEKTFPNYFEVLESLG